MVWQHGWNGFATQIEWFGNADQMVLQRGSNGLETRIEWFCNVDRMVRKLASICNADRMVLQRDRLSSHSSMRLCHKTSCGSSPCPPHNRDNPLST